MNEAAIKNEIIIKCRDLAVFMKNSTGLARHVDEKTGQERRVHYGTGGTGGTDLIGWFRREKWIVVLEVKTPEKFRLKNNGLSKRQIEFRDMALFNGLCWAVVCSPEQARTALLEYRAKLIGSLNDALERMQREMEAIRRGRMGIGPAEAALRIECAAEAVLAQWRSGQ